MKYQITYNEKGEAKATQVATIRALHEQLAQIRLVGKVMDISRIGRL